jgi:nucleoid-associated protein YgaU
MKKYMLLLASLVLASGLSLGAQSLKDNPDFKKSLELKSMASQAFDDGDYDAAALYAKQAKDYASLSDQYVEKMLAKAAADKALGQAKSKMAWADSIDAKTLYPDDYAAASDQLSASLASYGAEDYPASADQAKQTIAAVDKIAQAQAQAELAKAKDKMDWADSIGAKDSYPDGYAKAADAYAAATSSLDAQDYQTAIAKADETIACVDAIAKTDADVAIAQAKDAMSRAVAISAPTDYPTEYSNAKSALADAQAAYDGKDYPTAAAKARACVAAIAGLKAKPAKPLWPAVYVVRLIPERRDCLWSIAGYPFIYNNPLKWSVIYEANKKTFRDPGNPNLIFPGQKLQIPSIKNEARAGSYDPSQTYPAFPK